MIISCPNCSEKYFVDSRNLKKKGIKLKCSSCSHTWFYNQESKLKVKNKEEKKVSYTPELPKTDFPIKEVEIKKYGLQAPIVGHVGDGNFHVAIIYDPENKESYKVIRDFSNKLIDKALSLEGTITGEHGIGIQKKEYLLKQHPDNIPLMQGIKKTLDPKNILNPGKIFNL